MKLKGFLLGGVALLVLLVAFLAEDFPLLPGSVAGASEPSFSPVFSPSSGAYSHALSLELRPTQPGGQIILTTDGTTPTLTVGTLYRQPLRLDTDYPAVTVVRAIEVVEGVPGPVVSGSYAVGLSEGLPVLSLIADPADLWDPDRGIFANAWQRGDAWERSVHLTWFEGEGTPGFAVSGGLRMHGAEPLDAPKQSFRLYFREAYGSVSLDYPLFPDHPDQPTDSQSYKHLLLQSGDRSGRWTLFRDQVVAHVASRMGLRVAQGRLVRLFVNGESWGIYRLSERVDRFFLEENYGLNQADVVQDGKMREGTDEDWDAMIDWVEAQDLSEPDTYATFRSQVDLDNFTDAAVLQLFFDFPTEDLYAVRPRGGRWFWVYAGGAQDFANAPTESLSAFRLPESKDDFSVLLRALLENAEYRTFFSSRAADLLNTALDPIELDTHRLVAGLRDDMQFEVARWPSPLSREENVAQFQAFVQRRPAFLREQIAALTGLGGSVELHFESSPAETGRIFVNGLPVYAERDTTHEEVPADTESWSGRYYAGSSVQAIAVPEPDYAFVGWEANPSVALGASPLVTLTVGAPLSLTALFAERSSADSQLWPDDVVINELWINDNGTRYVTLEDRPLEGDWLELWVRRPEGVDLRGWRVTDNDTKTGMNEGSLIFPQDEALATVPRDTVILILATESLGNAAYFPEDDLDATDGRLIFYIGNGNLDVTTDPGFAIGTGDDNLALLAPGPTAAFDDDIGVDFVAEGRAVTPYTFGILADGVTFDSPFRRLGGDDGALFVAETGNDRLTDWVVDPPLVESGDVLGGNRRNIVTPGSLNEGQSPDGLRGWLRRLGVLLK